MSLDHQRHPLIVAVGSVAGNIAAQTIRVSILRSIKQTRAAGCATTCSASRRRNASAFGASLEARGLHEPTSARGEGRHLDRGHWTFFDRLRTKLGLGGFAGRVDLGGCPPRPPTDPDVPVKGIRFVTLWRCPSHDPLPCGDTLGGSMPSA